MDRKLLGLKEEKLSHFRLYWHDIVGGRNPTSGENLTIPIDDDGCFTGKIIDFNGRYVKDVDKDIIEAVKAKGRLVKLGTFTHSYPFCWRSDTPLIYRIVPSWYV
ncbi:hypothetical protein CRYUN_Cryun09bG0214700 [Craigia yunnanensis]